MSVRSNWSILLFKSSASLLIFCLIILSIVESGALKSAAIIIEQSISPPNFVYFSYIYLGPLMFGAYV